MNSLDASGRLKDLEATCEDLRRRLSEERQVKENFEDLLSALKGELLSSHNERDNLRDEIVPQLRARVEGLEAQAAHHEKLTYEQSKMQQELQSLKEENMSLSNSQRRQSKFDSIVEDGPMSKRASGGLTRSASLALGPMNRSSRPPSLSRSTSVKVTESREALADRVRDIELQRDSLHRALKSLLDRQEHQNRENSKKIRQLELERDRALSNSPRRLAYDKEVATLREEINTLRHRADDAIEQKWQCEKGLGGLKMDLDRSEQEIGSLRSLLQANDILIPASTRQSAGSRPGSARVSSESLETAYRKLQAEYTASLERVKALERSGPRDEDTERAMKQLEQSLSNALSERDHAKEDANASRQQAESAHLGREAALADGLRGSAQRVEELAGQVRQQLASNALLRERLASTIERGEQEQKANASKIMLMQSKLKALEDQLMAAQQASEETISRHEEEVRSLKDNHNLQLQRSPEGARSPRLFAGKSPLSPMFANSGKSPRIATTTSGTAKSVAEDSNMALLKQRVVALESALAEADRQMEEVVGRMNIAQIEVMNLQNEREDAVRETRALQKRLEEEKKTATRGIFG
jgi:chromosome segregation ATPase